MTVSFSQTSHQSKPSLERPLAAYFSTINDADFEATAALFAADGTLYPPFGQSVTGHEAIALYLAREATGMRLCPDLEQMQVLEQADKSPELQPIRLAGQVQTSFFRVKVGWLFVLNASGEIQSVRVNLLANLEDLVHLKCFA